MNSFLPAVALVAAFFCAEGFAQNASDIEAGEAAYDQHCASCHGEKVRGSGALPDLRDLGAQDRERFNNAVMEGRGQMPSFQGMLTAQEIEQVWAYIRSRARG